MRALALIAGLALAACSPPATETAEEPEAPAAALPIQVQLAEATAEGPGATRGFVEIRQTPAGAVFALSLQGLPEGAHGFHVHEAASCQPMTENGEVTPAGAARSHWDPEGTGVHLGPNGEGHLGDLPVIEVGVDGMATQSLTAPRIDDISRLRGHALMIHAGGDNYSDQPEPLGGGGARIACGVIL